MTKRNDEHYPRRLTGTFFLYGIRKPVPEITSEVLARLNEYFPGIAITHASGSYDFNYDLGPTSERFVQQLLESDYRKIVLSSCEAESGKVLEHFDDLQVIVEEFFGPRSEHIILHFGIEEHWVIDRTNQWLRLFDTLASDLQFQSGHCHDLSDSSNQNQRGPHWFKVIGEEPPSNRRLWDTLMQEEVVDIEQNPCHSHIYKAVDFTAAWTNYLGREYLDYLGLSNADEVVPLVQDSAHEVVLLGDSLVRVTLFSDPFAFGEAENIERLWKFRRRLKIDEVAHALLADEGSANRYVPLPGRA